MFTILTVVLIFWAAALASPTYPVKGRWEVLAPITIAPRQEHAVVAVSESTLAIVGGIIPNPNGEGVNTTNILQFYDIHSDAWRSAAPAPIEVNHPNVAAVDGKIYLLGGLSVASDGAWRAFSESWVYDPHEDQWSSLDPIPGGEKRGSAAVAVYGKTIYLAGGMRTLVPGGPGGEQDTVDFVSAFDTASSKWINVPEAAKQIPEGRDHSASSVVGSKFYLLGGRLRGQYNVKDTVFVLDFEDLEAGWTVSKGRMPTPRGGVVGGAVDGTIYVMGGEGNSAEGADGIFDEVEAFDTKTETWEKLEPMRLPRHGGMATSVGGGIYLPGGGIRVGGAPVDDLDVYWP
ncbi:hypothetical protein NM208_g11005 [Fusarium decemcellulare]|uniref:Uncharacterized protein n=1 Tax=Fusarium decemcellulare TaxID=57161 RepID=A0ACC1RVV1_9HYPO|nr:hypothetical protein NM208_g11005 [Fusarium decemcellulare]